MAKQFSDKKKKVKLLKIRKKKMKYTKSQTATKYELRHLILNSESISVTICLGNDKVSLKGKTLTSANLLGHDSCDPSSLHILLVLDDMNA